MALAGAGKRKADTELARETAEVLARLKTNIKRLRGTSSLPRARTGNPTLETVVKAARLVQRDVSELFAMPAPEGAAHGSADLDVSAIKIAVTEVLRDFFVVLSEAVETTFRRQAPASGAGASDRHDGD